MQQLISRYDQHTKICYEKTDNRTLIASDTQTIVPTKAITPINLVGD
jgi:hypothetical protein